MNADCCSPCATVPPVNIPGTPGLNGLPGFTLTTASFVLPVSGATVTVAVASTAWMVNGITVGVGDSVGNTGTFTVVNIVSSTSVTLQWLGLQSNSATGTTINSGAVMDAIGSPGVNAYSIVTAGFSVPQVGSNVPVTVNNNSWMAVGQNVFITGPANFQVVSLSGATGVLLQFLGYNGDVAPGFNIPANATCSPAGLQGALTGHSVISIVNLTSGNLTYTPPTTAKALYVECLGAGGSGGSSVTGSSSASYASGGGGGGYSAAFITSGIQQAFLTSIGSGGAAPAAGNNAGNSGGATSFATALSVLLCQANGGSGGLSGGSANITPGLVSGGSGAASAGGAGDIVFAGECGGHSQRISGTLGYSGRGGSGPFGGGALALTAQGSGNAGGNYGSGGSGAASVSGASAAGGAGANGLIRITVFG